MFFLSNIPGKCRLASPERKPMLSQEYIQASQERQTVLGEYAQRQKQIRNARIFEQAKAGRRKALQSLREKTKAVSSNTTSDVLATMISKETNFPHESPANKEKQLPHRCGHSDLKKAKQESLRTPTRFQSGNVLLASSQADKRTQLVRTRSVEKNMMTIASQQIYNGNEVLKNLSNPAMRQQVREVLHDHSIALIDKYLNQTDDNSSHRVQRTTILQSTTHHAQKVTFENLFVAMQNQESSASVSVQTSESSKVVNNLDGLRFQSSKNSDAESDKPIVQLTDNLSLPLTKSELLSQSSSINTNAISQRTQKHGQTKKSGFYFSRWEDEDANDSFSSVSSVSSVSCTFFGRPNFDEMGQAKTLEQTKEESGTELQSKSVDVTFSECQSVKCLSESYQVLRLQSKKTKSIKNVNLISKASDGTRASIAFIPNVQTDQYLNNPERRPFRPDLRQSQLIDQRLSECNLSNQSSSSTGLLAQI